MAEAGEAAASSSQQLQQTLIAMEDAVRKLSHELAALAQRTAVLSADAARLTLEFVEVQFAAARSSASAARASVQTVEEFVARCVAMDSELGELAAVEQQLAEAREAASALEDAVERCEAPVGSTRAR